MGSWEHVLELVTIKAELFTPAKRQVTPYKLGYEVGLTHCSDQSMDCGPASTCNCFLAFCLIPHTSRLCTLDGRTVHAVSEIQDGGKYVAIEGSKPFRKVAYCATEAVHTLPAHRKRLVRIHLIFILWLKVVCVILLYNFFK